MMNDGNQFVYEGKVIGKRPLVSKKTGKNWALSINVARLGEQCEFLLMDDMQATEVDLNDDVVIQGHLTRKGFDTVPKVDEVLVSKPAHA